MVWISLVVWLLLVFSRACLLDGSEGLLVSYLWNLAV